jgi:trehalose 6-phosphate synthase
MLSRRLERRAWQQVIVANRAPTNFIWQDGAWQTQQATNALSLMLGPLVQRSDVCWYCCAAEPAEATNAREALLAAGHNQASAGVQIIPVPVPAAVYAAYYDQICNETLWMVQHGIIGSQGYELLDAEHSQAWAKGYEPANRQLALAISESVASAGAFLIHDYHLYLLPALLRRLFPEAPILHYTHIPFPPASAWKLLPAQWRQSVFQGLLGANIIGLQTQTDARNCMASCEELVPAHVDWAKREIEAPDGRRVRVRVYPASVTPHELRQTMVSDHVCEARKRLAGLFTGQTIVRVDRLDPSKNQVIGFLAFAHLLERRPDFRGRVRFLAFLVPSRGHLHIYQKYHDTIYRTVEQINNRFCDDCEQPPIEILYTNNREQALVAMEQCDVLLVNSRADGMNLVAKEWAIVSQRPGVLVLSELAGVAQEAVGAALLVSPLDVIGTSRMLELALDMSPETRGSYLERFRARIRHWTAAHWLQAQFADLGLPPGEAIGEGI